MDNFTRYARPYCSMWTRFPSLADCTLLPIWPTFHARNNFKGLPYKPVRGPRAMNTAQRHTRPRR